MIRLLLAAAAALAIAGCSGSKDSGQEAAIPVPEMTRADSNVVTAEAALRQDSSEENFIWYGRRLGYVQRMDDAIAAFTAGLVQYPESWKLLRFRGHRYISTRQFARAIDDLEQAAKLMEGQKSEIEPDGEPNALNIPLSTYQYNVWYHLGLAHYLTGDFEKAIGDFRECLKLSANDDLMVASCDWLYMSCRRAGDDRTAMG
ncbi:MAG: tetratricopeptide repeat protein, partial [Bacteroidota bacterium]